MSLTEQAAPSPISNGIHANGSREEDAMNRLLLVLCFCLVGGAGARLADQDVVPIYQAILRHELRGPSVSVMTSQGWRTQSLPEMRDR